MQRSLIKDLLLSIPVLLMYAGFAAVAFLGRDRAYVATRYQNMAERAYAQANTITAETAKHDKHEWAFLCYRKAEEFETLGADLEYRKAICLQALGRSREAAELMQAIAKPPTKHVGSRIWLVQELIRQPRMTREDLERLKTAEEDIEAVLKEVPDPLTDKPGTITNDSLQAYDAAWRVKRLRKGPAATIHYLKRLAPYSMQLRLELASAHALVGNTADAAVEARLVRQQAEDQLRKKPDDMLARLIGVKASYVLKEWPQALKLLDDGIRTVGPEPELNREKSVLFYVWSEDLAKSKEPQLDRILALLFASHNQPPVFLPTYNRLASISMRKGPEGEAAKQALISALARGQAPGLVHSLLGDLAYSEGKVDQASRHWQLALDVDPGSVAVMNNLAMGLAGVEKPTEEELQLALQLVDKAIEKRPLPPLYDTKTHVLFRLKKYQEALVPLNKALAGMPENWQLRLLGAQIYKELGLPEEANRFATEAEKLRLAAIKAAQDKKEDKPAEKPVEPPGKPGVKPEEDPVSSGPDPTKTIPSPVPPPAAPK